MAGVKHRAAFEALTPERGDAAAFAGLFPRVAPDVTWAAVDVDGVAAEWVSLGPRDTGRAILYFHGGGFTEGSPRTHRELVSRISRHAGVAALSVDYRLAPLHPFPAALQDARRAWDWLTRTVPADRIALVGDSAGGGLALALLLPPRDAGVPLPAICAVISPWCDLEVSGDIAAFSDDPLIAPEELRERGRWYVGDADPRNPQASPVYGRMEGLPPLFVQVGEREGLLEDSRRVVERARQAGVAAELEIWPGMTHVWHVVGDAVSEARAATERLGAAIAEALKPAATPSR